MSDLAQISNAVQSFYEKKAFIEAWKMVQNAKITVKNIEKMLRERGLEFMKGQGLTSLEMDERFKIIVSKKKADKFATDWIYEALEFTMEQKAVLPKNPKFRKTEVLKNPKTAPSHYIEEKEELEIKELDKEFLPKRKK